MTFFFFVAFGKIETLREMSRRDCILRLVIVLKTNKNAPDWIRGILIVCKSKDYSATTSKGT